MFINSPSIPQVELIRLVPDLVTDRVLSVSPIQLTDSLTYLFEGTRKKHKIIYRNDNPVFGYTTFNMCLRRVRRGLVFPL